IGGEDVVAAGADADLHVVLVDNRITEDGPRCETVAARRRICAGDSRCACAKIVPQGALTARRRTGRPSTMSEVDLPPVRGQLLRNETLAPFTWFRVGGAADVLFLPADGDDLAQFLAGLPASTSVLPIGVGSNLIVRDGGVEGVVIRLA